MKFKFKNLLLLILITFDLFLLIDVVNLYNANYVGRFNITDPASLYIVINRQNHKDNMFLSYQDTVIGLSYDKVKLLEFALIFNIYEIDYYIDYTMYEHINLKIKNFSINSMGGAYIIEALNFNFVYVHNADEINFTYVLQRVDKIDVLNYREENYVNNYICGNYQNYMFSYMLPSTGYIDEFKLILYHPGFMIQYQRSDANGKIPPFDDAPIFNKTIKEAARWSKIIDGDLIAQINRYVEADQAIEFVNMCETKHNRQLAELGYQIKIDEIRLHAGPLQVVKQLFHTLKNELLSWELNQS